MCTLSVIARKDGYALAMNRDERITRGEHALAPQLVESGGLRAVMPRETSGGTWLAANEGGIALALLNWHVPALVAAAERSRGVIIPALIGAASLAEVQAALEDFELDGIRPFRLIGVFPGERAICEWRWNSALLELRWFDWGAQHWFSSGLSDAAALLQRAPACRRAWRARDAGSLAWLRRLHRSHRARPRELAICVHREGVETLSYTEVVCARDAVRMRYVAGPPCRAALNGAVALPRLAATARAAS